MVAKRKAKSTRPPAVSKSKTAVKRKTAKKSARTATRGSGAQSLAGRIAPAFSLSADDGSRISLKDFRGRRVILYFYPKDDTTGCTAEACAFRDALPDFSDAEAIVLGVSKDNVASHKKFSHKYDLNFPLLVDDSGVCEAYGVWKKKSMYGRTYMGVERSTFLIDRDGKVRAEWRKVSVPGHAAEVLKTLQSL